MKLTIQPYGVVFLRFYFRGEPLPVKSGGARISQTAVRGGRKFRGGAPGFALDAKLPISERIFSAGMFSNQGLPSSNAAFAFCRDRNLIVCPFYLNL